VLGTVLRLWEEGSFYAQSNQNTAQNPITTHATGGSPDIVKRTVAGKGWTFRGFQYIQDWFGGADKYSGTILTIARALPRYSTHITAGLLAGRKRLDGRSHMARRIKQLMASYVARLGDAADSAVRIDLRRLCELEAICEAHRAAALRQEPVDLAVTVRLEGCARRLRKALGLDKAPEGEPLPSLAELGL
jgi:hypothetical protein